MLMRGKDCAMCIERTGHVHGTRTEKLAYSNMGMGKQMEDWVIAAC